MSLENPTVPDAVKDAIKYIDAFLQPGDPSLSDLRQQQYWQWTLTLGLEELAKANTQLLGAPVGWRYLIGNRNGQALAANIDADNKLVDLFRGPAVTAALNAARELKTLPEAADGKYQIRLLTIPGLLTEAFWLKSQDSKPDLIVPFSTAQELRLGHPYPVEKFLKIMQPLAEAWLAGWAKVKEPKAQKQEFPKADPGDLRQEAEKRLDDEHETQIRTKARQIMAEKRSKEQQEKLVAKQRQLIKSLCK
jgi:hypothetical protein